MFRLGIEWLNAKNVSFCKKMSSQIDFILRLFDY